MKNTVRKILCAVLALVIAFGSVPAFATDDTDIGYNNPTEDLPVFGEMIMPSDAELLRTLVQSLQDETFCDFFDKFISNDPSIFGFCYFMLFVPLWGFARISAAL